MKESILDVLLYLFEHYFTNDAIDPAADLTAPDGPLMGELVEAGFSQAEVRKAFDWLDTLARQRPAPGQPRSNGPTRVFHGAELDWVSTVEADSDLTAAGVMVLGVTPTTIVRTPTTVLARIEAAWQTARSHDWRPQIRAVHRQIPA